MPKKFFLISQVFYPDEVSTAGLFTQLCERLVESGIEVEVWCAQPSYNVKKKQPSHRIYRGIQINYLPSTNFSKNNFAGRMSNYLTFTFSLFMKFLFSKEKATPYVSTNPPYLAIILTFLCRVKNRKLVYLIQDLFPEGLVRLGKLRSKSILVRYWNSLNQYTLKHAHKVIVLGRDMQKTIQNIYPDIQQDYQVIPIWQDEKLIAPIPFSESQFAINHNLTGKFIIQYSGNMGLWNDMAFFAEAISQVNDPSIHFTFIGDGIRKREMFDAWGKSTPSNVSFYPFQPKAELNDTLAACHVALISLRKNAEGVAVPSKIMGILAVGCPVIAVVPEESEISYIVKEEQCGIQVTPGQLEDFLSAITRLKADAELRTIMGINARSAFEKHYSLNIVAKQYMQLIKS